MSIIMISRGTMSGVHLLVQSLASEHGYRSVSREDLIASVNRHGELANRIVEQIGRATKAYEQFTRLRRPYLILMRLALLEELRRDNVVYHGYSGHLLLPPMQNMLLVRINAPTDMRVRMTMDRLGCGEEAARDLIVAEDEHWGRWARFMYGRDIRDPALYDVVVDLRRMPMNVVCAMLEAALKGPRFTTRPETVQELETLLLATRIEAELAADPRVESYEIAARVDDDRVRLVGPWLEESDRALVLEVAHAVAGDHTLEYQPGYEPVAHVPTRS